MKIEYKEHTLVTCVSKQYLSVYHQIGNALINECMYVSTYRKFIFEKKKKVNKVTRTTNGLMKVICIRSTLSFTENQLITTPIMVLSVLLDCFFFNISVYYFIFTSTSLSMYVIFLYVTHSFHHIITTQYACLQFFFCLNTYEIMWSCLFIVMSMYILIESTY